MHTNKYIKRLTVVLVTILLFSCSQEEEEKPKPLTYSYETVERFHPNCKDQDNENGCVELTYTYPIFSGGDDIPVKDTLQKAVADFMFDSTGKSISEASFNDLARDWFAFYDSTLNVLPDYDLTWKQRMRIRLIHQTPDFMSVEFSENEFTGGAHGNEIKVYRMYSIPGGERLKLEDVLKEDEERNQLAIVAEPVFQEQKKFPDDAEYDERNYFFRDGQFSLNENYALTEKGLLFHFNPYEIAPYSEGATRLLLTYEQIDSLLADPFKPSSDVNNE